MFVSRYGVSPTKHPVFVAVSTLANTFVFDDIVCSVGCIGDNVDESLPEFGIR